MWKLLRISILLLVLSIVIQQLFLDKADWVWQNNLYVCFMPDKQPRYPQYYAEQMGGYRPIGELEKKIPASLNQVLMGFKTAKEIGWIK